MSRKHGIAEKERVYEEQIVPVLSVLKTILNNNDMGMIISTSLGETDDRGADVMVAALINMDSAVIPMKALGLIFVDNGIRSAALKAISRYIDAERIRTGNDVITLGEDDRTVEVDATGLGDMLEDM